MGDSGEICGITPAGSCVNCSRLITSCRAATGSTPYSNWLRIELSSKSELLRVYFRPGIPARVISSGMVTCRSTSSAEAPGNWAITSTIGGAGSG